MDGWTDGWIDGWSFATRLNPMTKCCSGGEGVAGNKAIRKCEKHFDTCSKNARYSKLNVRIVRLRVYVFLSIGSMYFCLLDIDIPSESSSVADLSLTKGSDKHPVHFPERRDFSIHRSAEDMQRKVGYDL